jgi:primosomal protein N' (replication factor Y) (superfamily II helicase)
LLDQRKRALFPPFIYQAVLRAESLQESALTEFLDLAARAAASIRGEVTLYDPVPATIAKIAGHHRAHLLAQCASRSRLQRFLLAWRRLLSARDVRRVRWCIDVDPLEL